MEVLNLNDLKVSYYEYIMKIPNGLKLIVEFLENNNLEDAFTGLANFAEGLEYLIKVEQALFNEGYTINSRLNEANEIFEVINESLVNSDQILLKDLIEYELIPLLSSASEWTFEKKDDE